MIAIDIVDVDGFAEKVDLDIRGRASESDSSFLRHPDNVKRWLNELLRIRTSLESQIVNRKAILARTLAKKPFNAVEEQANFDKWEARVFRVKCGVEDKIREAQLLYEQTPSILVELQSLKEAIKKHKNDDCDSGCGDTCVRTGLPGCAINEELWAKIQ